VYKTSASDAVIMGMASLGRVRRPRRSAASRPSAASLGRVSARRQSPSRGPRSREGLDARACRIAAMYVSQAGSRARTTWLKRAGLYSCGRSQ
jgi:hypothetical protein